MKPIQVLQSATSPIAAEEIARECDMDTEDVYLYLVPMEAKGIAKIRSTTVGNRQIVLWECSTEWKNR